MLVHSKEDKIVLPSESRKPCEKLVGSGVRAELIEVEGAGHGLVDAKSLPDFVEGAAEALQKASDFVSGELRA